LTTSMIWLWRLVTFWNLDQFSKRGMDDAIQRLVVKKTFEAENLEKLRGLVAKFETAIQESRP
jgi:hypothetical protein